MSRLLDASGDEVLPYLALGAFAGIRTAELMRLTWDCIRFDKKVIEVRAGITISQHLSQFGPDEANSLMFDRLTTAFEAR